MGVTIRAVGRSFDADLFSSNTSLPVCAIFRRGEPRHPVRNPKGPVFDRSGVNVDVSDADFEELPQQINDAIEFLRTYSYEVRQLCDFQGVEEVFIDFGFSRTDSVVQSVTLPAELVRLAGTLGLDIELSLYPPIDSAE